MYNSIDGYLDNPFDFNDSLNWYLYSSLDFDDSFDYFFYLCGYLDQLLYLHNLFDLNDSFYRYLNEAVDIYYLDFRWCKFSWRNSASGIL
jgi:hypothetical protein